MEQEHINRVSAFKVKSEEDFLLFRKNMVNKINGYKLDRSKEIDEYSNEIKSKLKDKAKVLFNYK